jgi:hypothetical protein
MAITNDKDFKAALAKLSPIEQRQVAARFVQRVFALSGDVRVKAALDMALRPDISDAELAVISHAANTARVESYTQCGKETDWNDQAGHFVAKAAATCVRPAIEGQNLAWDTAMQVRVARTCDAAAADNAADHHREAEEQYAILDAYLSK